MKMKIKLYLLIYCASFLTINTQSVQSQDSLYNASLKVFFDCPFCDEDHVRREVTFVNYVRDRKEAQVHIMITSQKTGSGGTEYSFLFIGQEEFEGQNDTLLYATKPDITDEETREGQIRTLKLGLMRYVAKTPVASHINITYDQPQQNELIEDRWKSWVFKTSLSGYLSGEKSYKSYSFSGSISATKITPDWKIDFDYYSGLSEDKISTDDETIYSTQISHSLDAMVVKSLGEHWSVGGTTDISSSTYSNYKLRYKIYPGIEYDIFPYSESTRKKLSFQYTAGYSFHEYRDSTIYDKLNESLLGQELNVSLNLTQKWGSIYNSLSASNYFHDWTKNNFSIFTSVEIRIAKGLELNFGASASIIHDQINLVKGEATTEEILLRIKELETSFQYFLNFGLSYTFGAIYNNVVNPRFGGGGMRFIYYGF
jgi:hypothetical protein